MSFANLSSADREIVISGKGHKPAPGIAGEHDMVLSTAFRLLSSDVAYDGWVPRQGEGHEDVDYTYMATTGDDRDHRGETAPSSRATSRCKRPAGHVHRDGRHGVPAYRQDADAGGAMHQIHEASTATPASPTRAPSRNSRPRSRARSRAAAGRYRACPDGGERVLHADNTRAWRSRVDLRDQILASSTPSRHGSTGSRP
jgi:hypothetical protein